ncbi:MAG TPA: tetratricopeptide repeat protein [Alphaproteobacteria bacterium]|nr:tetratricopeptide repeat protein [Alphaproteobacteria bacterium]
MSGDPLRAAVEHLQRGELDQAERACEKALSLRPMHAGALGLAAVVALKKGEFPRALHRAALAVQLEPRNAQFQFTHAEALSANEQFAEAIEAYRRSLKIASRNPAAEFGLGYALQMTGDTGEALAAFQRATILDPQSALGFVNLGAALQRAGRLDEAQSALTRAVTLAPEHAEAHYNLAVVLEGKGDFAAAEAEYRAALARKSDHVQALNNLGALLERRGQADEGLKYLVRVLRLAPGFAEAWLNTGNCLKEQGLFADAVAAYSRAIELKPELRDARKNRGLARLTLGDFAGGWRDHQARDLSRPPPLRPEGPLPADLSGKTILLRREQGVGDEIFFLAFAPELARRGAHLVVEVDHRLVGMIGRTGIAERVVTTPQEAGRADIDLLIADLPVALTHSVVSDCPPPLAIPAEPRRVEAMRARLAAAGPAPYLGVTWRAGVVVGGRFTKEIPASILARALAGKAGSAISLQRNPTADETAAFITAFGRPVANFSDVNDDLEDMLALVSLIDEYVAVSNTNVHLRTACGRATRVLVPHPPEWRLMAEGSISPWYPRSRLYRQAASGSWDAALAQLAADLGK